MCADVMIEKAIDNSDISRNMANPSQTDKRMAQPVWTRPHYLQAMVQLLNHHPIVLPSGTFLVVTGEREGGKGRQFLFYISACSLAFHHLLGLNSSQAGPGAGDGRSSAPVAVSSMHKFTQGCAVLHVHIPVGDKG